MAYWQNGKLHIHLSTQSTIQTVNSIARWLSLEPTDIVLVSEYCGGGYGSKATGSVTDIIPALLAKKTGTPVMMRLSREEEHMVGRARPAFHSRVKVGFAKDGRITAVDMFTVVEGGPYGPGGDGNSASRYASLMFQPEVDAVARHYGHHQHAASRRAEPARRHAGHHDHGADRRQSGAAARHRSGRDSQDQLARRQGEIRPGQRARRSHVHDELLPEGGARQRRARVRMGGAEGAQQAAQWNAK